MCACTRWLYMRVCVCMYVVVQRPTWRGRRRQQQQTLHRLNQLERKCVFLLLPLRSCTSQTCGMICTMSPGTRAYKHKRRESPSCGTGEKGGGYQKETRKRWMDCRMCIEKLWSGAGSHPSWRRFPSWWNRKSREGNRRLSLSFPPPPSSSPPNVSNSDEMRLNIPPPPN
jgi:hypothetical protein